MTAWEYGEYAKDTYLYPPLEIGLTRSLPPPCHSFFLSFFFPLTHLLAINPRRRLHPPPPCSHTTVETQGTPKREIHQNFAFQTYSYT